MQDSAVEDLRTAWPIERALEHYGCEAGRRGLAPCPFCFHIQATPAPTFSYTDRVFHCFRCGERGDVFKFVMTMEGTNFAGALRVMGLLRLVPGSPLRRRLDPPVPKKVFGSEDVQRERQDFLLLDESIRRRLRHELRALQLRVAMGLFEDEADAEAEKFFIWQDAERRWDRLDQARSSILYYLGRAVRGAG